MLLLLGTCASAPFAINMAQGVFCLYFYSAVHLELPIRPFQTFFFFFGVTHFAIWISPSLWDKCVFRENSYGIAWYLFEYWRIRKDKMRIMIRDWCNILLQNLKLINWLFEKKKTVTEGYEISVICIYIWIISLFFFFLGKSASTVNVRQSHMTWQVI